MNSVRNCKRCNRIFTYTGKVICPNCLEEEQKDFDKVREYLFGHLNSTTIEVSDATGVEIKVITRFLKEGRLESENLKLAEDESLACEKCNRPIGSGRYCENCLKEMQGEFAKASQQLLQAQSQSENRENFKLRMHTYDDFKKQK